MKLSTSPDTLSRMFRTTGEALLTAMVVTYIAAIIVFLFDFSLNGAVSMGISGAAVVAAFGVCMLRLSASLAATAAVITISIVALSLSLASQVYDLSWDGLAYHQGGVIALTNGWNPLYESYSGAFLSNSGEDFFGSDPFIQSYPRASWIISAVVHLATGSLPAAKAINLVAAAAAFCIVYAVCARVGIGVIWALAICGVATLNPVALTQGFTFYVDGLSASLITALIAGLALLVFSGARRDLAVPVMSTLILVNLKFSILVIVVLICIFAAIALVYVHGRAAIKLVAGIVVAGVIGTLLLGWSPYIQNLLAHGHPFHPVMGNEAMDIISANRPPGFASIGNLDRFLFGIFGEPGTTVRTIPQALSLPFSLDADVFKASGFYDQRIGGFGPLFPAMAILATGTLIWLLAFRTGARRTYWLLFAIAALAATVLIHPENWWARYVPQLWLIPVIIAAAAIATGGKGRYFGGSLLAVALLNSIICAASASVWIRNGNVEIRQQHASIIDTGNAEVQLSHGGFMGAWYRLNKAGIEVSVVADPSEFTCRHPTILAGSFDEALYCTGADAPAGLVSFTFENATRTQYEIGFRTAQTYDFVGTLFVPTGPVDLSSTSSDRGWYMNWSEVREFHQAGWEIASNGQTGRKLPSLDPEEIEAELLESSRQIETQIGVRPVSFASAADDPDTDTINQIMEVYDYHLSWNFDGRNERYLIDPSRIGRMDVRHTMTAEQICGAMLQAAQNDIWLILLFHEIVDGPPGENEISAAQFVDILACADRLSREGVIQVQTVRAAMEAIQSED